jgi:electron transport complex protein RnfG
MALSLLAITMFSAAALGLVYKLTLEPIAASEKDKQLKAIQAVTPAFDNLPAQDRVLAVTADGDSLVVYPAMQGGVLVGAAVEATSKKGFSGLIKVMIGFNADGTVRNYFVLQHAETPGLGSKMQEWFCDSVKTSQSVIGLNPAQSLKVKKDGGEVDAITAATISSRAFLDAINRAYSAYNNYSSVLASTKSTKTEKEDKQ